MKMWIVIGFVAGFVASSVIDKVNPRPVAHAQATAAGQPDDSGERAFFHYFGWVAQTPAEKVMARDWYVEGTPTRTATMLFEIKLKLQGEQLSRCERRR